MKHLITAAVLLLAALPAAAADPPPNVVILYADDLGYADLGCTGATGWKTPHLDQIAADGVRFTSFMVAQAVCSASRAALLTGCYPNRVGIHGALGPRATTGLAPSETTLAEVLKTKGYATAAVGKWHLGHHPMFLPTAQGFDSYLGLPYSNDMGPRPGIQPPNPPLPLIDGTTAVIPAVTAADQETLTRRYTDRGLQFIAANKAKPFFLYMAYTFPHVPLHASAQFRGSSKQGLYGDVVQELDASVGELMAALKANGVADRTLVVFASDNGPWLSYGNHAGGAGPLREGKGTAFEGGIRVPCVMRLPGVIPAGTVQPEPAMTIDLLPTIAKLAGAKFPERGVDGKDILPLMKGTPGATCPHDAYYIYFGVNELRAVRSGRWKLVLPHTSRNLGGRAPGADGKPAGYAPTQVPLALYDLTADIGETTDVQAKHPDIVARLQGYAEAARVDLGDALTKRVGKNVRPAGHVPEKPPLGKLSEKYESGNRGPGTVSTGVGDPGGVSYGTYQLASKIGRADEFVKKHYPKEFEGLKGGTPEFTAAWKKLADADPVALHAKEHEFIRVTHYDPQAAKLLKDLKLDVSKRSAAFRDVVWSTATQHGPGTDVIVTAARPLFAVGKTPTDAELIRAVYAERGRKNPAGTLARFKGVSAAWIPGLTARFEQEQADALKLLAAEGATR